MAFAFIGSLANSVFPRVLLPSMWSEHLHCNIFLHRLIFLSLPLLYLALKKELHENTPSQTFVHWKIKNSDCSRSEIWLQLVLGGKPYTWPVIGVWHEGVVVSVPHSGPDKDFLIQWFGVIERHAFGIDIFHQLEEKRSKFRPNFKPNPISGAIIIRVIISILPWQPSS